MLNMENLIKGKCPKCEKGNIFSSNGNIFLIRAPKMNKKCDCCNYTFEKEPGYFLGAFYVSYALTVAELLGIFLILHILTDHVGIIISIMFFILVLLSFFNFRISRLLWIYMFNK